MIKSYSLQDPRLTSLFWTLTIIVVGAISPLFTYILQMHTDTALVFFFRSWPVVIASAVGAGIVIAILDYISSLQPRGLQGLLASYVAGLVSIGGIGSFIGWSLWQAWFLVTR